MIVVIGAGPAGLATAWRLTDAGHEVVVVEATPHLGGMAGSRTVSGIPVDLGGHQLDPGMPTSVRTAIERLDDVELQERPRRTRVRMSGSWVPYPIRPIGTVRGLGLGTSVRLAAGAAAATRLRSPSADSFAEVQRAAHGATAWMHLDEPYARKLWDTDPALLAATAPTRRDPLGDRAPIPDTYLYPRDGLGSLWRAIADRLPDVRLRTKVTGLIEHDERVTVGLADGRILSADRVFATLPAGRVATWLGLVEPAQVVVPTRAMLLVYLAVATGRYTTSDTHLLPERTVLPVRVSEPTNHRDRPDPADRTVLCAEIPCWEGDAIWNAPADTLARRVADDLVRCDLPDPRVIEVHVERLPSADAVPTRASRVAVDHAETALTRSRRVATLGEYGLFTPVDHALQVGFAAADSVG